jgi:predicted nuclease with TOPRIM domain
VNENAGWFDRRLSIGNLITIFVVMAGLFGSWYQFKTDLALQQQALTTEGLERTRLEARIVKMEAERDDTRDRLTRIEVTMKQLGDTSDRILRAVERPASGN